MTQLIGVICENREQVILISDRMVTTVDESLAFEHEAKSAILALNAMVLTAGTIHEPELVENTKDEIKERAKIFSIAEVMSKHYRKIRKKRIVYEVLEEMGFSSFDEFHQKQQILHQDMILEISRRIERYVLGVTFLFGGVDDQAHLYRIDEPGTYSSFDALGFCCVGSGVRHADPVFAFYGFSPKRPVGEALQIAFQAKKRAEMAGGVGKETDAWVIKKEGIYEIQPKTIQFSDDSYAAQEDFSRLLTEVDLKIKKVELKGTQT